MTLRNMSTKLTIGRIALQQTAPREIRVVKAAANDNETPEAKLRRLEIAQMMILAEKYPVEAREIVLK